MLDDPKPSCVAGELGLIKDLLDVSRAEAGLLSISLRETDIAKLINEITSAAERARSENLADERWTAIDVVDAGPGIPTDKMEEIFEEFSRRETAQDKPGSGLGLSIARRVARLLGGDIEVENVAKGGAVFTLWLPSHQARHDGRYAS